MVSLRLGSGRALLRVDLHLFRRPVRAWYDYGTMAPAKIQRRWRLRTPRRFVDELAIVEGSLGPVAPCKLEIRPLTVFVGQQGTGKSLVAQVLYAFEELPFLTQYVLSREAQEAPTEARRVFSHVLDNLRSSDRRFAAFASEHLEVQWTRSSPWEGTSASRQDFRFRAYHANRLVTLRQPYSALINTFKSPTTRPRRHAVFLPTERMVVSQLRSALAQNVLSLPITYELFSDWLELAASALSNKRAIAPRAVERAEQVRALGARALRGRVQRHGTQWKWVFKGKRAQKKFDLDLASSGQRANWSIVYLAEALFFMRGKGDFARTITLFVEEPELHLHPAAQRDMAYVLAVLINGGFRAVVTTHSLTFIYALNNAMLAYQRFGRAVAKDRLIPPRDVRLNAESVSVYAFSDGAVVSLLDRDSGFIDERELGEVGAELGMEMNYIAAQNGG